jgi:hypothetical protein
MATHRAVEAAGTAVVHALQDAFDPLVVPDAEPLRFHLVGPEDLAGGLPSGLGVLVYAVETDPAARNVDTGIDRTAGRTPPGLPLVVRLFVLVSAEEPATRLALAGWAMRTLHDTAVLPADLLNRGAGRKPVVGEDETARILADPLEPSDLLRRLEVLGGEAADVLALPYAVTGIDIVSG